MKVYFLRRLLLVPLTVLGVTFLVFAITRVMPGSPLAKELQAAAAGTTDGGGGSGKGGGGALTEEQIEEFEREFLWDKPTPLAYLTWLGGWPRERLHSEADFKPATQGSKVSEETIGTNYVADPEKQVLISLAGTGRPVVVQRKDDKIEWARFADRRKPMADWQAIADEGWEVRYEPAQLRFDAHLKREKGTTNKTVDNYVPRAVIYKSRKSGLLQGDFGRSSVFGEPVSDLII